MEMQHNGIAKIKVIGVGGGGNNAVNRMIDAEITSAEFVAVNTDKQALSNSKAKHTLVIGMEETHGLGAGADPAVGEKAAISSSAELRSQLKGVDLLFITAGMGGGTGTGAAPIIANIAHEMGILTVAVVTKPFEFEGIRRMRNAEKGVENLRKYVDTLVVIPNQKLLEVLPEQTTMVDAFIHADDVLKKAVQGISDMIVVPSLINLDFADVRSIMKQRGLAHMGIGEAEGPDRMLKAVRQAVMSPLLETNIGGSSGIILNVIGGPSLTLAEVAKASKKVQEAVDESANIIFGAGIDSNLGDKVQITLIATGFGCIPVEQYGRDNVDYYVQEQPSTTSMSNEEFRRLFTIDESEAAKENVVNNNIVDNNQNAYTLRPVNNGGYTNPTQSSIPQYNQDNGYNTPNFGNYNTNNNSNYGQPNSGNQYSNMNFGQNNTQMPNDFSQRNQVRNPFADNNMPKHDDEKDTSRLPAFIRRIINKQG